MVSLSSRPLSVVGDKGFHCGIKEDTFNPDGLELVG